MRLSKKTFCYSISIAFTLVLFVTLYFAFMLPSLYVQHMQQGNLDSIVAVQRGFIENRSYENLVVKNPTGSASLEIPMNGNKIYVAGKAFQFEIEIKDVETLEILDEFRDSLLNVEDGSEEIELPDLDVDSLKEKLFPENQIGSENIAEIKFFTSQTVEGLEESALKIHPISDSFYVFEGGLMDGDNHYSTYIAFSKTKDAFIFSFLPVMTPQMTEIRPIVLQSLPMIVMVVLLLVLVSSQLFAGKIVDPVIRLARYADEVKSARDFKVEPLVIQEKDEIGELGNTLNELYALLGDQYQELKHKNQKLASENKRQEVFLRASSHQLKTPITAALLLVEGMIGEIGKYRDTATYLPEVKKQLQSMKRIVEDILYLNHCVEHIQKEAVDMEQLMNEVVENHQVQIRQRNLIIHKKGSMSPLMTDSEIILKIIDNLISNAICYTPSGNQIEIILEEQKLTILNQGGVIDTELLPHIFDPFVSSNTSQKGHGLGLYIASYYSEVLGMKLDIQNTPEGVAAILILA